MPRAQTFAGILRTSLLKRFESSVHAFRLTLSTMIQAHEQFVEALSGGRVLYSGNEPWRAGRGGRSRQPRRRPW